MLKLDLSKLSAFLPEGYAESRADRLEKAAGMLAGHTGPGGDFTGWVNLPRDYDKAEFVPGAGGHRHRGLLSGGPGRD